jgi:hypothetical protein
VRRMEEGRLVGSEFTVAPAPMLFTQVHKYSEAYEAARPRIRLSDCGLTPT